MSRAPFPPPIPDPTPAPSGTTAIRWANSAPPRTSAVVVDRSHRAVLHADRRRPEDLAAQPSPRQHVSDLPDGAVTENLSLDGQGRVEDHWIQTELDGVTYLDTEPWRGEPLLAYLRRMVFWADVDGRAGRPGGAVAAWAAAGRRRRCSRRSASIRYRPKARPSALADGGFVRRMAGPGVELDLVVPRDQVGRLAGAADRGGRAAGRRVGLRGAPGGGAATAARRRHRRADDPARGRLDRHRRAPGQGLLPRARKPSRGSTTWANRLACWCCCTSTASATGRRPATRCSRAAARSAASAPSSTTSTTGPIALALLKRGLPADTALTTGGEVEVPAVIDADSMPRADVVGAGRLAVERLRGGAR